MIPIARPILGKEEADAVLEVLESGQLAQGPKVRAFEEEFAHWCGSRYAVATSSGTSALHVALLAHGIGRSDEVITSPFSFVASANCALYVGARPVFADIEPDYYTLDPADAGRKITGRTKALIVVHLYGQPCDMAALTRLAEEHGLVLIQDACQAHGAAFGGQPVGAFGTACYSFYPTKNMTTAEGGMITTDDPEIAEKCRMIRDHGSRQRYDHEALGYNLRMTDLQAAIGLVQLPRLTGWNEARIENAAYLTERLTGLPGVTPPRLRPDATHVYHQYTIRTPRRDEMAEKLRERGVGVGVHYPVPIHQQPLYRDLGYADQLEHAELASRQVLSLPVHPLLTQEDLERIVAEVARAASRRGSREALADAQSL